jgi:hypothetical protein
VKKSIQVLAVCLLAFVSYKIVHWVDKRNDGFAIEKIHSDRPNDPKWEVAVTKEQVELANTILNQPFHYLGRGFQCYAFESADGRYVLKFFRHQRMRLPSIIEHCPDIPGIKQFKAKKKACFQKRMNYLCKWMKIGFENAPEETALLFVHINKTKNQHGKVEIIDKVGDHYFVELDQVQFMLQHKAVHIKPTIEKLMAEGKVEEAKRRLDQIYELLVGCAKRGIQDTDGALIRKNNLGYLGDHAIYIDSGKLALKESIRKREVFAADLKRLHPLYRWLEERYPVLANHFEQQKIKVINEF